MTDQQDILRIEIPVEEEASVTPVQDTAQAFTVRAGANRVGQEASRAVQKAWDSKARKSATGSMKKGVQKGVTAVAAKSTELMHEHMVKAAERQARQQAANLETRIRETDWKSVAGKGATAGLRWASNQIERLAVRLMPKTTTDEEEKTPPH